MKAIVCMNRIFWFGMESRPDRLCWSSPIHEDGSISGDFGSVDEAGWVEILGAKKIIDAKLTEAGGLLLSTSGGEFVLTGYAPRNFSLRRCVPPKKKEAVQKCNECMASGQAHVCRIAGKECDYLRPSGRFEKYEGE